MSAKDKFSKKESCFLYCSDTISSTCKRRKDIVHSNMYFCCKVEVGSDKSYKV